MFRFPSCKAAIGSLSQEAKLLQAQLETTEKERDTVSVQVQVVEQRKALLAAEVDEQNLQRDLEYKEMEKVNCSCLEISL